MSFSVVNTDQAFKWKNSVLVIVANRFGIKSIASEYFPSVCRFMKLSSFVGLVGGKPNKAFYICGVI